MKNALIVFLGGGAGSVLRYLFGLGYLRFIGPNLANAYPWPTLACNIGASFLLGMLAKQQLAVISPTYWLLMAVGLCGGWSTFSTFSMDAVLMLRQGRITVAIAYMALSFLLSLGAFWFGYGPLQRPDPTA